MRIENNLHMHEETTFLEMERRKENSTLCHSKDIPKGRHDVQAGQQKKKKQIWYLYPSCQKGHRKLHRGPERKRSPRSPK
jgi:hypothetical protein